MTEYDNLQYEAVKRTLRKRNIASGIIVGIFIVIDIVSLFSLRNLDQSTLEQSSEMYFIFSIILFFMIGGTALLIRLELDNHYTRADWNVNHPGQTIYSFNEKPISGPDRYEAEKLRGTLDIVLRYIIFACILINSFVNAFFGYQLWFICLYIGLGIALIICSYIITAIWNRKHPETKIRYLT